jgi:hypothetical protein
MICILLKVCERMSCKKFKSIVYICRYGPNILIVCNLNSLISVEFFLFFLRKFSQLHVFSPKQMKKSPMFFQLYKQVEIMSRLHVYFNFTHSSEYTLAFLNILHFSLIVDRILKQYKLFFPIRNSIGILEMVFERIFEAFC